MSCWCEELVDYECFDCEKNKSSVSGLDKTLLLRHVRLCLSNSYDMTNSSHRDLAEKIIERKLCPSQLGSSDIKNIQKSTRG